ncbi:MAG: dihydroxyacetone kinase subunit L [Lactobacillus sp.]|jgi:dihydroxyacetone kinase phosphoprotein-dependent L subunit|nr:dihydroxyacetone kinase subunit L [Lactobacillus sp.]
MFKNSEAISVPLNVIAKIEAKTDYLGDLDELGDGDHGVNMDKGMHLAKDEIDKNHSTTMTQGFDDIKDALMNHIGGSMGPLYGMICRGLVNGSKDHEEIDAKVVDDMMQQAVESIEFVTDARPGDKTLIDTVDPAADAMHAAVAAGDDLPTALDKMVEAAKKGMNHTKDLQAQIGRSIRQGKKTIGKLDAGAVSCEIFLEAMAEEMKRLNK